MILEVPSVPTAAAAPSVIGRVIRLDGAPHGAPWDGQPKQAAAQVPLQEPQPAQTHAPKHAIVRSPL